MVRKKIRRIKGLKNKNKMVMKKIRRSKWLKNKNKMVRKKIRRIKINLKIQILNQNHGGSF
jgi:hypothetical protein